MKTIHARQWIRAVALGSAMAAGTSAFGNYVKEWKDSATPGYWTDSGCWNVTDTSTEPWTVVDPDNVPEDVVIDEWRILHGSTVKFATLVADTDTFGVLVANGNHKFVADASENAGVVNGLSKANASLYVVAPWWYTGSTVLELADGAYEFANAEVKTDVTNGGSATLTLNGATLTLNGDVTGSGTVAVGSNGATLNTNNKEITIATPVGGAGTLNVTGGGKVTFTVMPTCTVVENGATVVYDVPDGNFYWTGASEENTNWSNPANWKGGVVPSTVDDVAVLPDGAVITLSENATVGTVKVNGAVSISGAYSLYFLNVNKGVANSVVTLGDGVVLCCAGSSAATAVFDADMNIEVGSTVTVRHIVDRVTGGGSTNRRTVKITGSLKGYGTLWLKGDWRSNVLTLCGSNLASTDNSEFYGTVTVTSDDSQQRDSHTIAASATSGTCHWRIYADCTNPNYAAGLFKDSGTASERQKYYFGSLALRLPANYSASKPLEASNIEFVVGNLDTDSSLWGTDYFAGNSGIRWVAQSATLTTSIRNAAYIDVVGGGNVGFGAVAGVPATLNFAEKGGCLVLSDDSAINAAAIAAVKTEDLADDGILGFYYDGEGVAEVNLSTKANDYAGKKIVKRGSGTVRIVGLPGGNDLCDVTVEAGTLVLPYGAAADAVDCTAEGAVLQIDVQGALDGAVVFSCTSLDGELEYLNKSSAANIAESTTEAGKVWTLSFAAEGKTFVWNGSYDGAAWREASNWLVNDETADDIPSVIDTALFTGDAVVSATGTIAAGVVELADGVTLTIPTGLTFNSLELGENAKVAFAFDTIGNVGGSVDFITVKSGDITASGFDIPAQGNYSSSWQGGVLTVTRVAATYIWSDAKGDQNWATSGNWKVGEVTVAEVPAAEDSVEFPASDAEGFTGWTVTLPWDVYAETVTLNADVILSGARSLKAHTINGSAELKLSNAHIGCNGQDIVVNCPLNILPGTTDYIYLSGYNATLNGALYGSGKLISDANKAQYKGVTFKGDVSEFYGEFEATNYNNRDATNMTAPAIGSENAVWRTNPHPGTGSAQQSTQFVIHDNETTYKFGAYIGGFWVGDVETPHIEIGNRDDVDSSFGMTSLGSRGRYVITKVGGGNMTITNGKGDPQIGTLYPNGGTSIIRTIPGTITFNGDGVIKTPIYNAGTEAEPDMYYADVSGVIKNSTGPVGFTNDAGEEHTWANAIDASNEGGFIKDGDGTLTLGAVPQYKGVTWVKAGTLIIPSLTPARVVDPRSQGTLSYDGIGDPVESYAYSLNAVLDGTESEDDWIDDDLDISNLVKVDLSDNADAVESLTEFRRFDLARTSGELSGYHSNIDLVPPTRPEGVDEKNWQWTVKVVTETINGETWQVLCVVPKTTAFLIKLR